MAEEIKQDELQEEIKQEDTENVETVEDTLEDKVTNLTEEIEKWKNDYYKVYADMENTRKRLTKEHETHIKYAMQSFVEELLPVIDNFERSLMQKPSTEEGESYLKGNKLILDQLMAILEKNGVEVIEALGKTFDPNFHQAVMTEHDETKEENIVLEELQKGYMLKGRVIRATLVKVNQ